MHVIASVVLIASVMCAAPIVAQMTVDELLALPSKALDHRSHTASYHPTLAASLKQATEESRLVLREAAVTHRNFGSQQFNTSNPLCDKASFETLLVAYGKQCSNYKADALFDMDNTNASTTAEVEKVCTDECAPMLNTMIANFSDCLNRDILLVGRVVRALCKRDTETKERCSVTLKGFKYLGCDKHLTPADCTSSEYQCQWSPNNKCEPNAKNPFLTKFCRPCLRGFLQWGLRMNPGFKLLQYYIETLWCRKIDGEFCMPRLGFVWGDNTTLAFTSNRSQALTFLSNTCGSGTTAKCFRSIFSAYVRVSFEVAKDVVGTCIERANTDAGKRVCYGVFVLFVEAWANVRLLINFMCLKNAKDSYCLSEWSTLTRDTPCFAALSGGCNQTCSSQIGDTLMNMGCCKEALHRLIKGPRPWIDPRIFPARARALANSERPTPVVYNASNFTKDHVLGLLSFCPTINGNMTIYEDSYRVCPRPRLGLRNLTLRLLLPFAVINGSEELRQQTLDAAQQDIANAISFPLDDLENATVSEDKSVSLDTSGVTASAGHAFLGMQGSSSTTGAVVITTTVAAETASDADAAQTTLAQQQADDSFSASTTTAMVANDCPKCVSDSDASVTKQGNTDKTAAAAAASDLGSASAAAPSSPGSSSSSVAPGSPTTTTSAAPSSGTLRLFSAAAGWWATSLVVAVAFLCLLSP